MHLRSRSTQTLDANSFLFDEKVHQSLLNELCVEAYESTLILVAWGKIRLERELNKKTIYGAAQCTDDISPTSCKKSVLM